MPRTANLARRMEKQLPVELVEFMEAAGLIAASQGLNLYLVGGVVRDLLLKRTNLDLDLVVEGSAIDLVRRLADIFPGKITVHARFNTAKLKWNGWSIDLATTRSETYEHPGALPKVAPGSLASDLFRRDFTINAMAVELIPARWGHLIDRHGGRQDLEDKLIRILHDKSFIDDATRIWRALRYEQRLDFKIETRTLHLLKRDTPMLATISSDRLRHELELVLKEEFPEKALHRADELGVLARLQPSLQGDGWLAEKFAQARHLSEPPSTPLYLALLCYRLTPDETEHFITDLNFPKSLSQTLRETSSLKANLSELARPRLKPSRIYQILHGYSSLAITVNLLACDIPVACRRLRLFENKLRYIRPSLTGTDLLKMGIPQGPKIKEILQRLLEARLDGEVSSKQGEVERVKEWPTEERKRRY
ncbi:MAG: CCA tRNA nucleotidyltransferase [Chloroflexota bacterium]